MGLTSSVLKLWILNCWLCCSLTLLSCPTLITGSISEPQFPVSTQFWKQGSSGSSTWPTCLAQVPLDLALSFLSRMFQGLAGGRQHPGHRPVRGCVRLFAAWFLVALLSWGRALLALSDVICCSPQHLPAVPRPTGHNVLPAILDPSLSLLLPGAHLAGPSQPGPSLESGLVPDLHCGLSSLLLLSHFSRVRLCATHRRQPTRLLCPWDSPGKNAGVGCHFLLQCMKVKSESEVAQCVRLLATPWTVAYQAPPSMGFSRQEYWSGVPSPSPSLSSQALINPFSELQILMSACRENKPHTAV